MSSTLHSCKLLVSVRSAEEAKAALAGGADIIDVKEPTRGALGMADAPVMEEIIASVSRQAPVSVALGELRDLAVVPALQGVAWAKIGLCGMKGGAIADPWKALALQILPVRLIGVCYADGSRVQAASWRQVLELVVSQTSGDSAPGLLIDTAIKDGKQLLDWFSVAQLLDIRHSCDQGGIFLALAGSLKKEQAAMLAEEVRPAIIAVRGAVCVGGKRDGKVDAEAVAGLKDILSRG